MEVTRPRLAVPQDQLDPARAVRDVELPGLAPWERGKVRSIYEAGPEHLVIVASGRLFRVADNLEHVAGGGIAEFVQPGGSMHDPEVIAACDERDLAMAFTDRRVFRHSETGHAP